MRTHRPAVAAALIVALEAVGLGALAVLQVIAFVTHDVQDAASGVALVALTVVGTAAVAAFAVAIVRGQSWGRSGGVVTQVLILAVALGAATGSYAHPFVAALLALPALIALVLLIVASRRAAAADRGTPE